MNRAADLDRNPGLHILANIGYDVKVEQRWGLLMDRSLTVPEAAEILNYHSGHLSRLPTEAESEKAASVPAPAGGLSLPDVVHRFKSFTTTLYRQGVTRAGWPPFPGRLWQRNYYEHIVRTDASLQRIRAYIRTNPERWALDRENPGRTG